MDAAKKDERDGFALLSNNFEDIFLAECELARAGCNFYNRVRRLEAMPEDLRSKSILNN